MFAGFSVDLLASFVLCQTNDVGFCILALDVVWNSSDGRLGLGHGDIRVRFEGS